MMAEDKRSTEHPALNLPSRKTLPPFESLRAFDAVARLGGIRKAAHALDRDHAVVSRHLRAIEAWTGATLIERTSLGAVLTEDGVRYHKQVAGAIDAIANATVDLMKRSDNHRLHIWCMPGFAFHWLTGRLGMFENANPALEIELRPTNASPDFTSHEADMDIRFVEAYGPAFQLPAGVKSMEIARPPIIAVASPDYLEGRPKIETPHDLLHHQLLHEEDLDNWKYWLVAHGVEDDHGHDLAGPRLWQGHLTLDAARHGRGVALTNYLVAADDLAEGRLIEIGKDNSKFRPRTLGIYLLMARADRWETPAIRRYRAWLLNAVAAELPDKTYAPAD